MMTHKKNAPRPVNETDCGEKINLHNKDQLFKKTQEGRISESNLLSRFNNVRKTGNGSWMACCPAHEDRTPSLSISDKDGNWLLKCFAGCSYESILQSVNLAPSEMASQKITSLKPIRRITDVYQYRDHAGKSVFEVVRYEPKDFRQRVPDASANGGYTYSLKGVKWFPIYRLPAVEEAIKSGIEIHLAEGEKDAETLADFGLVGTTLAMGSGKWKPEYAEQLRGARLVLYPDNDQAGTEHVRNLISKLQGVCQSIAVVPMPNGVKDVSDLFASGEDIPTYWTDNAIPAQQWLSGLNTNILGTDSASTVVLPDSSTEEENNLNIFDGLPCTPLGEDRVKFEVHLLKAVVDKDPFFDGIHCNEMDGKIEWQGKELDDCALTSAEIHVSQEYRWSNKRDAIHGMMARKAADNPINHVRDFLEEAAKAWDRQPRLMNHTQSLLKHDGSDYANDVIALLFLQSVARVHEPGCNASLVPVLVGSHGCGKSSFVRALVPEPQWHSDSLKVDHLHDAKRAQEAVGGAWIVEIAELAGMAKSEVESVKAWISAGKDTFRAPYKRTEETRLRRFIVVGTSNETNFLQDPTGNRRFAPVEVNPGGFVTITKEMLVQLWGEAVHRYRQQEYPALLKNVEQELQARRNSLHEALDPLKEAVAELTEKRRSTPGELKMEGIYQELGLERIDDKAKYSRKIGAYLRSLGWKMRKSGGCTWWTTP